MGLASTGKKLRGAIYETCFGVYQTTYVTR